MILCWIELVFSSDDSASTSTAKGSGSCRWTGARTFGPASSIKGNGREINGLSDVSHFDQPVYLCRLLQVGVVDTGQPS